MRALDLTACQEPLKQVMMEEVRGSITLSCGAAAATQCQDAMAEGIRVRLRDVTAGEEHSAPSRACWALAG